uniref:Uncharacterized protein n=1 Tax=Lactuca sativa TaxID=4236 RepID=A0A9R1WJV5_LACSA|nr:hypothetical protein LSAT_V11C200062270 [Lactuca sativa]
MADTGLDLITSIFFFSEVIMVYQSLRCLTLTIAIALLMMIWNLSQLKNLKELEVSSSKVTDHGVTFFKDIVTLLYLNLSRCNLTDNGCFVPLNAGLNNLESLNLDSCRIRDNGLINLAVK